MQSTRGPWLSFLAVWLAVACWAQDQPAQYAVVIGVSQFSALPKEEWLEFAHADAEAFANFLKSPRGRAFPPDNVFLMTNQGASYQAVRSRLGSTLPKRLKPEDTVYIFIATHGVVEKEAAKQGYLLAHDSDREDLYSSALLMKDLGDIVQTRLRAKRIFLFADACRAGKLGQGQGMVNQYMQDVSRSRTETMGLLASRPNEFSREGPEFGGGHGVFTFFLLKGLMGEADTDKDKTVTLSELVPYVQDQVRAATDRQQNVRESGEYSPETPMAFVDKPGPPDLKLGYITHRPGTLVASMAPMPQSQAGELRDAIERAVQQGRLLSPAGGSAWDLWSRYAGLNVAEAEKESVQETLTIALATAGDVVLSAYRRGDQVVRLDAGRYEEGARLFSRASELSPDERQYRLKARFMEGRALVARGQFGEAVTALRQAIALDPQAAYPHNALGIAQMELGQFDDAMASFRNAIERAEKWVYPRYNLASVFFRQGRFREAEQAYRQAIDAGTSLGLKYSYLHLALGVLYLQQQRYSDAEQQFRRAIEMNPGDANGFYNLGLVLQRRGRDTEAVAQFERAAEADPRHAAARLRLAELHRAQGRAEMSEKWLRAAVDADPNSGEALHALGTRLLDARRHEEAEQVFMRLLALDPASPAPLAALGDVHAAMKDFERAAEDYRQALARATDPALQRDLQKKLRSIERRR